MRKRARDEAMRNRPMDTLQLHHVLAGLHRESLRTVLSDTVE